MVRLYAADRKRGFMERTNEFPFMLDVSGLLRGETRQIDIDESVYFDAGGIDVSLVRSPRIKGSVVNMSGYIEFSAKLNVGYTTECARCLKTLSCEMELDLKYPVAESLENMDNDEYIIPQSGLINLSELVEENIILNLPLSHLCSEDCRGLCPKCGANLNEKSCSCVKVEKDPRWSALEHFFDE